MDGVALALRDIFKARYPDLVIEVEDYSLLDGEASPDDEHALDRSS